MKSIESPSRLKELRARTIIKPTPTPSPIHHQTPSSKALLAGGDGVNKKCGSGERKLKEIPITALKPSEEEGEKVGKRINNKSRSRSSTTNTGTRTTTKTSTTSSSICGGPGMMMLCHSNPNPNPEAVVGSTEVERLSGLGPTRLPTPCSSSGLDSGIISVSPFASLCHEVAQIREEHIAIRESLYEREGELLRTRAALQNIAHERDFLKNKVKFHFVLGFGIVYVTV